MLSEWWIRSKLEFFLFLFVVAFSQMDWPRSFEKLFFPLSRWDMYKGSHPGNAFDIEIERELGGIETSCRLYIDCDVPGVENFSSIVDENADVIHESIRKNQPKPLRESASLQRLIESEFTGTKKIEFLILDISPHEYYFRKKDFKDLQVIKRVSIK